MTDWGQVMLFRGDPFNISQKHTLMFRSFNLEFTRAILVMSFSIVLTNNDNDNNNDHDHTNNGLFTSLLRSACLF